MINSSAVLKMMENRKPMKTILKHMSLVKNNLKGAKAASKKQGGMEDPIAAYNKYMKRNKLNLNLVMNNRFKNLLFAYPMVDQRKMAKAIKRTDWFERTVENEYGPENTKKLKKICKPTQILNPMTGRCVLKSGKIGKKVMALTSIVNQYNQGKLKVYSM